MYVFQVLMRALRDFNLPKVVTGDVPIFLGLISDLFPLLDIPRKRDQELEKNVRRSVAELHLQPEENFILKVCVVCEKCSNLLTFHVFGCRSPLLAQLLLLCFLSLLPLSGDPAGGAVGSETLCFCSGWTWNRKKSGQSNEEIKRKDLKGFDDLLSL